MHKYIRVKRKENEIIDRICLKSKKEQWQKNGYKNETNTSKGKNKIHKNMERAVVLKSEERTSLVKLNRNSRTRLDSNRDAGNYRQFQD